MARDSGASENSTAQKVAILGALITGAAGVAMAGYSIVAGEETGAGALLAASALAFGLLARTVVTRDRAESAGAGLSPTNGRSEAHQLSTLPQLNQDSHVSSGAHENGNDFEPITDRELQVLTLVAQGYSNKRISAALRISERTVKNHLTGTMGKLRASDRTHAVVTAVRQGWLTL